MRVFVYFLMKAWYFSFCCNFKKKGFPPKYQGFGKLRLKRRSLLFYHFLEKHHNFKLSRIPIFLNMKESDHFSGVNVVIVSKNCLNPFIKIWFQVFGTGADWSPQAPWKHNLFPECPTNMYSFLWLKTRNTSKLSPVTGY